MTRFRRAKITPKGTTATTMNALAPHEEESLSAARYALGILTRRWFGDQLSIEANRILPAILLSIYVGQKTGRRTSKRDACQPLQIDPTKTGARYITMAEEHGFVVVDKNAGDDGRKDALSLTPLAIEMIDKELQGLVAHGQEIRISPLGPKELSASMPEHADNRGGAKLRDKDHRAVDRAERQEGVKAYEEPRWQTLCAAMSAVEQTARKRDQQLGRGYTAFKAEMALLEGLGLTVRSALERLASREHPRIPAEELNEQKYAPAAATDWYNFHQAMRAARTEACHGEHPGTGYELFKPEMAALQFRGYTLEQALTFLPSRYSKEAPASFHVVASERSASKSDPKPSGASVTSRDHQK